MVSIGFKNCIHNCIVLYLINEHKVTTLAKAAVLAYEFSVTNKMLFQQPKHERSFTWSGAYSVYPQPSSPASPSANSVCFYCHKSGHLIAQCQALNKKEEQSLSSVSG